MNKEVPKEWRTQLSYPKLVCKLASEDPNLLNYLTLMSATNGKTSRNTKSELTDKLSDTNETKTFLQTTGEAYFNKTYQTFSFPSINDKKVDLTKYKEWKRGLLIRDSA